MPDKVAAGGDNRYGTAVAFPHELAQMYDAGFSSSARATTARNQSTPSVLMAVFMGYFGLVAAACLRIAASTSSQHGCGVVSWSTLLVSVGGITCFSACAEAAQLTGMPWAALGAGCGCFQEGSPRGERLAQAAARASQAGAVLYASAVCILVLGLALEWRSCGSRVLLWCGVGIDTASAFLAVLYYYLVFEAPQESEHGSAAFN